MKAVHVTHAIMHAAAPGSRMIDVRLRSPFVTIGVAPENRELGMWEWSEKCDASHVTT